MTRCCLLAGCFLLVPLAGAPAADDRLPGDGKPLLQLQSDGPTAQVTSLAFGVRGEKDERTVTLYAGGYDKVIRTWVRDAGGRFGPGKRVFRLPIGPGAQGAINALAVSPDGRWLAAAGSGLIREAAGFFDTGFVEPRSGRLSEAMLQDEGTIYLFDTDGQKVRLLRGHHGPVLALSFAPAHRGKRPLLVSAAREPSARAQGHRCVVRLWDADRARLLATSPELPDPADGRPGLGIWHTGDEVRHLRVALACHGQPLRVWDAAAEAPAATVGEPLYFNEPAAFLPDGPGAEEGTLFTTGTPRRWSACLYAWKVNGAAPPQEDTEREVLLPEPSLSYALTLLSSRPGGRIDRAALVQCLREDNDPRHAEYRLLLLSVGPGATYGRRRAYAPLWKGGARPALAASPDGDVIAVAGGAGHEIRLYAPDDLSGERPAPVHTFRSPGIAFRSVAFVRKGEARGLLLNERPGGDHSLQGGVVFDVKRRAMLEGRAGWRLDAPDLKTDDWDVYDPPEGRKDRHLGFVVGRGGRRVGEVWLQEGQAYTAFSLLPVGPRKLPLLAIAFVEKGVPYLGLWNVRSGEQVRQLTGHLNPIRSLAFDAAGRRLVSAADDQMVCVWSLDDLEETLGRRGRLRGLAVRQQGAGLRLAEIHREQLNESNRAALESAEEGDRVGGLVIDGKLKVLPTPHAFYEAIWKLEPAAPWREQEGERAVIRIDGRDVTLQVDQGIDDRNPLFTLFVTRGPERQWVGWSPQGPYDTGDLVGGERYIGWHTNTGDADAPTTFAEAAKYHKEFYRDGILHFLLLRGNLPAARKELESQSAVPPSTDVAIAGLDPAALRDPSSPPLAQHLPLTLQARVTGIDPGRVASVEWQLFHKQGNGWEPLGEPRPFDGANDLLQVDLTKKGDWQRGDYEARVAVKLVQHPPAVHTKSVWFRYLPPQPSVTFSDKWLQETFGARQAPERYDVRKKQLSLQARVAPGTGAAAVQVQVRHNGHAIREESGAEVSVKQALDLREGRNDVEIVAVNARASDTPELRRPETRTRRLTIYYTPNAPPPRITLLSITPAGGEALPLRPGEPVVITSPRVRVRGEINAESELSTATCTQGEEEPRTLSGFKESRRRRDFRIDEEVVVKKAGRVRLVFRAGTADQNAEEQTLSLDYHPELPRFQLTSPRVVAADAGAEMEITGRLVPPREPYPYKVDKVLVNGAPVEVSMQQDPGRLKVPTALRPGRNRLQVFLSNSHSSRTEEAEVYRQRPPRIVTFKPVGATRREAADLQVVVDTAADLPLTQASYRRHAAPDQGGEGEWVNLPAGDWKKVARDGVETWTLLIKGARLRAGANGFTLRVANGDGAAAPAEANVEGQAQRPDPPEVALEDLPRGPVAVPRCDVTLRVRSSSPLHELRLFRNGREVGHRRLEKPAAREGRDVLIYRLDGVPLEPGMNALTAEASNDGGWASARSANVSFVEQTVDFRLEGYRLRDEEGALLPLTTEAADSRVEVHGWLKWPADAGSAWKRPMRVRVWVNDFEQRDVPLQEGQDGARRFHVPLCLTRSRNRVCLRFPEEVKLRQGDRPECLIRCRKPESRQRLHLLVVAPGEKNVSALTERVLTMFGAQDRDGYRFRTPAFVGGGRFYGPIPYYITPDEVIYWLPFIRSTIINSPSNFSDVVLVYFQGQLRSEGGKHYLLTWAEDDKTPLKEHSIEVERLRRNLGDVLGAKVLLLDVQGDREAVPRISDASLLVADLCYLWQSGASDSSRRRLLDDLENILAQASVWGEARRKLTAAGSRSAHLTVLSANPEGYDDIPFKK
jgi:WD40 repeat protein